MEEKATQQLTLELDKTSNVFGIDPRLFAAADEEFLIYSPTTKSYLFMSKDPSFAGSLHTKLEVRSKRDSERNFFKLIKVEGKDVFYLKNVKTEKFVHNSGEHVLGASGDLSEHEGDINFLFEFEVVDGNSCYKIKNNGKYLFVSKTISGIPPNHVVHASTEVHDSSDIFQFVLAKDAKEATIQYDLSAVQRKSYPLETINFEYKNEGEEDKIDEQLVKKEYPSKEKFSFTGLTYNGIYTGGYPAELAETFEFCILSDAFPRSTVIEDGVNTVNQSCTIITSPGKITTVVIEVTQYALEIPIIIHLTTANKKTLTADGTWTRNRDLAVSNNQSTRSLEAAEE